MSCIPSPAGSRAVLIALLLLAAGCSCGSEIAQVRWPASPAGVRLDQEILATAQREGARRPLSASGQPVAPEVLPSDAPGIRARSFVFEGLWVAELELGEAPEGAELPLVVMFHGRGDRPRIPGGPFARVPTPMRVIVPRGPLTLGNGFAWARHSVTQNRHDELAADLTAIADRLIRLIDHVRRTRPTAGTPVVTGFSQGAMVAWTLAARHPAHIGLAIPMAGWVPPAARPTPLRAPPTRAMHGTADPIVRIEPTREWVRLLGDAGNEVTWLELEGVAHVVTPEMNIQFEEWLEEAMRERSPTLEGGLGVAGADPEPMEPYDPPVEIDSDEAAVPAPLPPEADVHAEEPLEDALDPDEPAEDEDEETSEDEGPRTDGEPSDDETSTESTDEESSTGVEGDPEEPPPDQEP